jgi:hypothetical protein
VRKKRKRRRIGRLKILLFFDVVFHCSVFIMGTLSLCLCLCLCLSLSLLSSSPLGSFSLLSFLFSDPIQIADSW